MRRIALACAASLLIYLVLFAAVFDRPLTLGALRARIDANLTRGATLQTPKLVILAGSNGPYSHRCEIIEPIVGRPCVNAGIAVGIGLDYLFVRWRPLLRPGDIVYLPLEEAQYPRPRATTELGPDAAIMLRHDWATLVTLPLHRQLAALFASNLRGAVMSVLETILVQDGFHDPREATTGAFNAWGDHVGHTLRQGKDNQRVLAAIVPFHPTAEQIRQGYGSELVAGFIDWARPRGIQVIGGLPTGFADSPIPQDSLTAIRAIYRDHGAVFLQLPNDSRYPRSAFFDTADHLNEPAQIRHSVALARALNSLTRTATRPDLITTRTRPDVAQPPMTASLMNTGSGHSAP